MPYQSLCDAHFGSKLDATKAVRELGDVFALRLRPDSSAKGRGGKCGYYVCECHGCTSSLAPRGKQPFRLVLRKHMRKGEGAHGHTFHFVKDEGQHEHGYLCTATKTITPMVGHRSDVRNKDEGACPISARKELPREYLRFSTAPNPPHAALRGLPPTKLLLQQDALHDRPGTAGAAPPGCVSTRRRPLRGGPSTHLLATRVLSVGPCVERFWGGSPVELLGRVAPYDRTVCSEYSRA